MEKNKFSLFVPALFLSLLLAVVPGCKRDTEVKQLKETSPCTQCENNLTFTCTAFITGLEKCDENNILKFDSVAYFTGNEALKAYAKDKKNDSKLEAPAGFYIRNESVDSLNFVISNNCEIVMQTLSHDAEGNYKFNEKITWERFNKLFRTEGLNFFKHKPFRLSIVNSEIVSIKEIYIP